VFARVRVRAQAWAQVRARVFARAQVRVFVLAGPGRPSAKLTSFERGRQEELRAATPASH